MPPWNSAAILAESAKWVSPWVPPGARQFSSDAVQLYVQHGTATIKQVQLTEPSVDAASVIRDVADRARNSGAARLSWTVRPGSKPVGLTRELLRSGGEITRTIDICAYDLSDGPPVIQVPDDVSVRPIKTREEVATSQLINAQVWNHATLTDAEIPKAYETLERGQFLGYYPETPAGTAGYSLSGTVARLWGAGVLPPFRSKGVYRSLVDARLKDATHRGATLTLVHAETGTSAPILQKLGFRVYGTQVVITLPLAALSK
jgi:hypothetical protein